MDHEYKTRGISQGHMPHNSHHPVRLDAHTKSYNHNPWSPAAANGWMQDNMTSQQARPDPHSFYGLQHTPNIISKSSPLAFRPSTSSATMMQSASFHRRESLSLDSWANPRHGPSSSSSSSSTYRQLGSTHHPAGFLGTNDSTHRSEHSLYTQSPEWPPQIPFNNVNGHDRHYSQNDIYPGYQEGSVVAHGQEPRNLQQRRPSNRDEFDGPSQTLPRIDAHALEPQEDDLPKLLSTLNAQEQDQILTSVSQRLSQCAFDFVARYQFPIPIEPNKREVRVASDREWAEWVHLLKRLATKRRIPTRVLYHGQIRMLTTVLESSLDMRPAARQQSRPLKDDRNILQLISSGLQVAKILKDKWAMLDLDAMYTTCEAIIYSRSGAAKQHAMNTDWSQSHGQA